MEGGGGVRIAWAVCRQVKIRVFKQTFLAEQSLVAVFNGMTQSFESFVSLDNERSVWGCETFRKCTLLCPLSWMAGGMELCSTLFACDPCIFLSLRRIKRFPRNLFWLPLSSTQFFADEAISERGGTVYLYSALRWEILIERFSSTNSILIHLDSNLIFHNLWDLKKLIIKMSTNLYDYLIRTKILVNYQWHLIDYEVD